MSYEVKGKFALVTGAGSGTDPSLLFAPLLITRIPGIWVLPIHFGTSICSILILTLA